MAVVLDTVAYDVAHTPSDALKSIWISSGVPANLRKDLADQSIVTVELFAALADTQAEAIKRLEDRFLNGKFSQEVLPKEREILSLQAAWTTASSLAKSQATAELRYAEDPTKIPSIPEVDRVRMRMAWTRAHPELLLDNQNEPHPKFLDLVRRDWKVHSRVLYYKISQIRVKADKIDPVRQISANVQNLIHLVNSELPSESASTDEQVFERLHAFFTSLEFVQIFTSLQFRDIGLKYIGLLRKWYRRQRGRGFSGVGCLITADDFIRNEVEQDIIEDPTLTYAAAFTAVLDNKKFLWDSASAHLSFTPAKRGNDALSPPRQRPGSQVDTPIKESRRAKKSRARREQSSPGPKKGGGGSPPPPPPPAQINQGPKPGKASGSKGGGKGKKGADQPAPKQPKIADKVWKRLCDLTNPGAQYADACRFWNSPVGCSLGEKCRRSHKCCACGGNHPWYTQHQ